VQIAGTLAASDKAPLQGTEALPGEQLADAIEEAFDYRGDITVELKTGELLEGYVFDRDSRAARFRMIAKPAGGKRAVRYSEVARLAFSGRDMADGKSWEAWVRKYAERKAAGESNIELVPEAIE